jgi:hypothetical protein
MNVLSEKAVTIKVTLEMTNAEATALHAWIYERLGVEKGNEIHGRGLAGDLSNALNNEIIRPQRSNPK